MKQIKIWLIIKWNCFFLPIKTFVNAPHNARCHNHVAQPQQRYTFVSATKTTFAIRFTDLTITSATSSSSSSSSSSKWELWCRSLLEPGQGVHYKSQNQTSSKHIEKSEFWVWLERANSVCFTNCCRNTVPYDWPGHREGSVAKFRSCTWNWINDAGRWAETNTSRIY